MPIRIITDSAADFTAKEREALRISCVPMQVIFGEDSYLAGVNLTGEEFWKRMTAGETPTTSQPSPDAFLSEFEKAAAAEDDVIYIGVSSALSGTVQSAMIASSMTEDAREIHIVDSLSASIGEKLLVLSACRMRDEGALSAAQIAEELTNLRSRLRVYANVDTLEYLARGGRLSRAAASIGTLAQLKPMIRISEEGSVEVAGKSIGRHRAIDALAKKIASFEIDERFPVLPVYSFDPANMEALEKKLAGEGIPCGAEMKTDLGPVLSAHVGPNAYGLAFIEKE